jgi:SAM-dependent methyltransferase
MNEQNLSQIYENRFYGIENYRNNVWKILVSNFFSKWIDSQDHILDLGCGYGEFINNVNCKARYAMDLNPKVKNYLKEDICFIKQDCSSSWDIESNSLDLVFSSNFFEHLPNKKSLNSTIVEIKKALKPDGLMIAMGPNIKTLKGKYWDFWDHHVPLSDASINELLELHNFSVLKIISKFLPYNMVRVRKHPLFLVSLYLKVPLFWTIFGKQFLIIAKKG